MLNYVKFQPSTLKLRFLSVHLQHTTLCLTLKFTAMAIVKNFWLRGTKKRLAGSVLYQAMGQTRQRELASEVSNPRTVSQQSHRVKWANLVNFYKPNASWMRYAFETKKSNQSEYNKMMSLNVAQSNIYLTKQAAAAGACVVTNYIMTQGSLPSISAELSGGRWNTNLFLAAGTAYDEEVSVADASANLLDNNPGLREGDQISMIRYTQMVNEVTGYPYVVVRKYEVILSRTNNDYWYNYMPFGVFVMDSFASTPCVGIAKTGNAGGFLLVLSRTQSGKTYVSTQSIVPVDNSALIAAYSSQSALEAAIASYGQSDDAFLSSDSANYGQNEPIQLTINSLTIDGVNYAPRSYLGDIGTYLGEQIRINFNADFTEEVSNVWIDTTHPVEGTTQLSDVSVSGSSVIGTLSSLGSVPSDAVIRKIRVVTATATYEFSLSTVNQGME